MGSSQSTGKRLGPPISDEDIKKYTGKTREEFDDFAASTPGVGKNQLAGSITAGPISGLGGVATAGGLGGWGPDAAPTGANRGMKFPPKGVGKVVGKGEE